MKPLRRGHCPLHIALRNAPYLLTSIPAAFRSIFHSAVRKNFRKHIESCYFLLLHLLLHPAPSPTPYCVANAVPKAPSTFPSKCYPLWVICFSSPTSAHGHFIPPQSLFQYHLFSLLLHIQTPQKRKVVPLTLLSATTVCFLYKTYHRLDISSYSFFYFFVVHLFY